MTDYIEIDATEIEQQARYKLMIASILPRPIAWVSTCDLEGRPNLAPFSFFTGVCSNPPTLLFCPTVRGSDGEQKDTLRNIRATGEFVVNVVNETLVAQMNTTAAEVAPGVDEFALAGLTAAPSSVIRAPRVLEAPISMECKLQQIVVVGDGSIGSGQAVFGTILRFHIRADLYEKGRILTERLHPVARLAGSVYCPVREPFEIQRPGK